jgi:hypothetical protein
VRTLLKLTALIAGCMIHGVSMSGPVPTGGAPPAVPHESGVWQKHQYSFTFMGFTSTYSCDGLADKLKLLLITSGARSDAKAQPGACASGFGRPDKFARADLTFYTLAPASDDPAADKVPAIWRPVALAARRPYDLGIGDCELVEQLKSNVLPLFTTRNVESHTTCVPHQDSGSVIDLKFEVLSAVPRKGEGTAAPPTGQTP